MSRHSLLVSTSLTAALTLGSAVAWAQQPAGGQPASDADTQGRLHFQRGLQLFEATDFNGALAEFQAAYELSHRASVLYNIGVTQQQLHHYPEAARAIEQHLREATLTPERRAQVEAGLREIQNFIGHITLRGVPNGARVSVDDDRVGVAPFAAPLAVGTGRHVILVEAENYEPERQPVTIAGGMSREVPFVLRPLGGRVLGVGGATAIVIQGAPTTAQATIDGAAATIGAPSTVTAGLHTVRIVASGFATYEGQVAVSQNARRTLTVHMVPGGRLGMIPFIAAGVVAVGAGVTGIIMGTAAQSTLTQFEMLTQEDPRAAELASTGSTQQTVANVMFVTAGVAAVAAVVLLTQTTFGSTSSTVDVAFAPNPQGGATAGLTVHF